MREDKTQLDRLMSMAIDIVPKAFESSSEEQEADCVVSGASHLIDTDIGDDAGRLKELFAAFTQKQEILSIMSACHDARDIQIFIGEEAGTDILEDFSLISAPYGDRDSVLGVLAVIGPTRMPYQKVIPTVDITAKLLSAALNREG